MPIARDYLVDQTHIALTRQRRKKYQVIFKTGLPVFVCLVLSVDLA